jgi:hypothetical protein
MDMDHITYRSPAEALEALLEVRDELTLVRTRLDRTIEWLKTQPIQVDPTPSSVENATNRLSIEPVGSGSTSPPTASPANPRVRSAVEGLAQMLWELTSSMAQVSGSSSATGSATPTSATPESSSTTSAKGGPEPAGPGEQGYWRQKAHRFETGGPGFSCLHCSLGAAHTIHQGSGPGPDAFGERVKVLDPVNAIYCANAPNTAHVPNVQDGYPDHCRYCRHRITPIGGGFARVDMPVDTQEHWDESLGDA